MDERLSDVYLCPSVVDRFSEAAAISGVTLSALQADSIDQLGLSFLFLSSVAMDVCLRVCELLCILFYCYTSSIVNHLPVASSSPMLQNVDDRMVAVCR